MFSVAQPIRHGSPNCRCFSVTDPSSSASGKAPHRGGSATRCPALKKLRQRASAAGYDDAHRRMRSLTTALPRSLPIFVRPNRVTVAATLIESWSVGHLGIVVGGPSRETI
jgi:hypothetical protein